MVRKAAQKQQKAAVKTAKPKKKVTYLDYWNEVKLILLAAVREKKVHSIRGGLDEDSLEYWFGHGDWCYCVSVFGGEIGEFFWVQGPPDLERESLTLGMSPTMGLTKGELRHLESAIRMRDEVDLNKRLSEKLSSLRRCMDLEKLRTQAKSRVAE